MNGLPVPWERFFEKIGREAVACQVNHSTMAAAGQTGGGVQYGRCRGGRRRKEEGLYFPGVMTWEVEAGGTDEHSLLSEAFRYER